MSVEVFTESQMALDGVGEVQALGAKILALVVVKIRFSESHPQ